MSLALTGSKLGRGGLGPLVDAAPKLVNLYLDNCGWLDNLAPLARLTLVFHEAWLLSGAPKRKNAPELG
jgi:hypothetical protein